MTRHPDSSRKLKVAVRHLLFIIENHSIVQFDLRQECEHTCLKRNYNRNRVVHLKVLPKRPVINSFIVLFRRIQNRI